MKFVYISPVNMLFMSVMQSCHILSLRWLCRLGISHILYHGNTSHAFHVVFVYPTVIFSVCWLCFVIWVVLGCILFPYVVSPVEGPLDVITVSYVGRPVIITPVSLRLMMLNFDITLEGVWFKVSRKQTTSARIFGTWCFHFL